MDCKHIQKYLNEYQSGNLDAELHDLIDQHLSECEICRLELASMESVSRFLQNIDSIDSQESLAPIIFQKLKSIDEQKKSDLSAPAKGVSLRAKGLLGIIILGALILTGIMIYRFQSNQQNYFTSYGEAGFTWIDPGSGQATILEDLQKREQISGSFGTGGSISAMTGAEEDQPEKESGKIIHTFDLSDENIED